MKLRSGHWFFIALVILALVSWMIYSYSKSQEEKRKAEQRRLQLEGLTTTQPPRGQGLATVLGAIFPFLL